MITDPNYVKPAHLTTEYYQSLPADSVRMILHELSGSDGDQPLSVVEQVSQHIEACQEDPNEVCYIY